MLELDFGYPQVCLLFLPMGGQSPHKVNLHDCQDRIILLPQWYLLQECDPSISVLA